jgi:hypothetical protein
MALAATPQDQSDDNGLACRALDMMADMLDIPAEATERAATGASNAQEGRGQEKEDEFG